MTLDTDHGFGLLRPDDREKMELILTERSDGSYGAPALQGMLTASVVGPEPVPMDWILQTVLSPPESEAIGLDNFPDFSWVAEKIEEWLLRIRRVFQQDPELFSLLVYMPKLKEGDTTPDPQTWCNGFVEGMAYNREKWVPLLSTKWGFEMMAPILMTSDPDEWEKKNVLNPFTELTPWELGDGLKTAVLAIYAFWSSYDPNPSPIRASVPPARNDRCPCGSGKKYKRCCGRSA
jgi:yecA family protein